MALKKLVKEFIPPALLKVYHARNRARGDGPPTWEYAPDGWKTVGPKINGWNVESVVETHIRQWPNYVRALKGPEPIRGYYGGSPDQPVSYVAHNIFMTYAYVLALAAHKKDRLSVLDWGSGLGQYYEFSKSLLPDVELDYVCHDLPMLCEAGRKVLPGVPFFEDDRCLERTYDLMFASSVLQYHQDWQATLARMARSTSDYLYLTRIPVVEQAPSFVVVQRPYSWGYDTEYLGWFFNRREILDCLDANGLQLVREFHIEPHPDVVNAPAPATSRGFLARRRP